ncbi:Flp family type IVb pilin [Roseomonas hellenica]|uniref:Flp family type IVb pilin n=2 Tax=Plastoroseomonas hellenica TaxID=2687306 RepID=A0ABS5F6X6_9PROT|nr:Flp family type IVb pilin [Plastoroseomonas hellenica]
MLSLRGDRRGASAIEYGLIAAGIALAIAASIPGIRTSLQTIFTNIATTLAGVD